MKTTLIILGLLFTFSAAQVPALCCDTAWARRRQEGTASVPQPVRKLTAEERMDRQVRERQETVLREAYSRPYPMRWRGRWYSPAFGRDEARRRLKALYECGENLKSQMRSTSGNIKLTSVGTNLYVRNYVNFGENDPLPAYAVPLKAIPGKLKPRVMPPAAAVLP